MVDDEKETHNRKRPLRGGQGTFDKNSVDSYPALLDFLNDQEFADHILRVAFKAIIRKPKPQQPKGLIPLTVVGSGGKAMNGTCMTSAGSGTSGCDSCNVLDD